MLGTTKLRLVILALASIWWYPSESVAGKPDPRIDRSYQLQPIPVINGLPGVQYVPMAALYPGVPTVLVPKQIDVMALHSTPAASIALPPQQQYHESEDFRPVQEPVLHNIRNGMYPIRKKPIPLYAIKRPTYYNFGRKKIGTHSPYQNQKVSSVSIEPSIDLTDQLQQLQGSYPSTTPAPASTYGPAKVLDHQHGLHTTTYLRPKGHHPHYHPKEYRVYSHMHKGHMHNHFIPPSYPIHKSQYHSSAKPVYSFLKPTASTFLGAASQQSYQIDGKLYPETYSFNSYPKPETFSTNHIRFPEGELKKSLLNAYRAHQEEILSSSRYTQPLKPHSDLTQAFVKEPGTINNYDASIPIKVPSKKPNQFEVKEILRNADVHFIDGTINDEYQQQQQHQQQYSPFSHYQEFDPSNPIGYQLPKENALVAGYANGIGSNHLDYYDQRDAASAIYPQSSTNHEEPNTSETVKIPVAVIKGTHGVKGHGAFPIKIQRQDQTEDTQQQQQQQQQQQKAFTPSSTNSDWIPMSGKPISVPSGTIDNAGDKYFADLLGPRVTDPEPTRIITANRSIGEIISGKIPGEFSPFKKSRAGADIITGKIQFNQDSEVDRRKGSVIDETGSSQLQDTSNHVVSSMIKFS